MDRLQNISNNYAWILGRQVDPGEEIRLENVFQQYCSPKVSSKDDAKKRDLDPDRIASEFGPNEYLEFIDWVENTLAVDRGIWRLVRSNQSITDSQPPIGKSSSSVVAKPAGGSGKRSRKNSKQVMSVKDVKRKIPKSKKMTPKEIAWLPYNEHTKKLIEDMGSGDIKDLKAAFRIVRYISGQERIRKLIETKISDLAVEGVS